MCLAVTSLAALNYQHPRGLLSFSLEVSLFFFSPFTALIPSWTLEALNHPCSQGRMLKAFVVHCHLLWDSLLNCVVLPYSQSSCLMPWCPMPGALLVIVVSVNNFSYNIAITSDEFSSDEFRSAMALLFPLYKFVTVIKNNVDSQCLFPRRPQQSIPGYLGSSASLWLEWESSSVASHKGH